MSLKILYTRVHGTLTTDISAAATLIPIDAGSLTTLQANVNFAGGDWTYLTFTNELYSEEIKVTGTSGPLLVVQRARSGSTAQVFHAADTDIFDHVGADAITDIVAANPAPSDLTFTGGGIASAVTTGNTIAISVASPVFTGVDGIAITGAWPNMTFANESGGEGCGCGSGSSGDGSGVNQVIVVSSILQAAIADTTLTLTLPSPVFHSGDGITVSGSWSAGYTISESGSASSGTVTSVGNGTGLTLTGDPTTNPTLAISNTGVTAGTYGAFTVNAQGQITNVVAGANPISVITMANGGTAVETGTTYTITLNVADVGVQGIVALADSGSPLNPTDDATAVTPKVLAQALLTVGGSFINAGSSTGEADGDYLNVISASAITLTILSGQKVLVFGECVVVGSDPTLPSNYAIGVFNSSNVKLYGSKKIKQNKQVVMLALTGPINTNISLVTTTLDPTAVDAVTSSFLTAIIF